MATKLSPEERISALEARTLVSFTDRALALQACTHKSYCNEHRDEAAVDNERLEFLGDAVVDLAVSHRLMSKHPQASEGELSKLRALIVNEEGLAKVARQISLGDLLLLGRGEDLTGGRQKASVLADALEAVIGAVYLDKGLDAVLALVDRLFVESFAAVSGGSAGADFKTKLQEVAQERVKSAPRYRTVSMSGPDHERVFEIEVTLAGQPLARANGRSKKEAEQAAAQKALESWTDGPGEKKP